MEGKHKIELNIVGDGREFLNYWDWAHGRDVVCEIKEGRLFKTLYDEDGKELPEQEIGFPEFIRLVKESVNNIDL
jgi:hypothetical protein